MNFNTYYLNTITKACGFLRGKIVSEQIRVHHGQSCNGISDVGVPDTLNRMSNRFLDTGNATKSRYGFTTIARDRIKFSRTILNFRKDKEVPYENNI